MTLSSDVTRDIIREVIKGEDYRKIIVTKLDEVFLQFAIDFFKRIVSAKLTNKTITLDWYKKEFIDNSNLTPEDIAIHAGLNKKTINNMHNTASKRVVIDASLAHYEELRATISHLIEDEDTIDLTITIKINGVGVDLTIQESLIVINAIAVRRAEMRGGLWSSAGKQVEKALMVVLCRLFEVPPKHFTQIKNIESMREVDFYLFGTTTKERHRCEVKLMGKGNPESADAIFAREPRVFVADKLSELNKQQANMLKVEWIELRTSDGYRRFFEVLRKLNIPATDFDHDFEQRLEKALFETIPD